MANISSYDKEEFLKDAFKDDEFTICDLPTSVPYSSSCRPYLRVSVLSNPTRWEVCYYDRENDEYLRYMTNAFYKAKFEDEKLSEALKAMYIHLVKDGRMDIDYAFSIRDERIRKLKEEWIKLHNIRIG